ncbi:flippase [Eubacterium sp. TM06-47]|nr:flippase [Eubacterium sp. TM06-47]
MKKSVKLNAFFMATKTVITLFFPLITFPYISRVLLVDKIGQYNFSSSIVSYFVLLADLGISTYAIREGSKIRDNKEKINKLMSELFIINLASTLISFILLLVCVFLISKLKAYSVLIFILSFQLFCTLMGRMWIYNIFEDFSFITVTQVLFQIVSIILMFVFVHKPEDVYYYALISVISSSGSNIICGVHSRKYVNFTKVSIIDLKKHIKPILIIFSTSIATTIYVNSDMTILGWIVDDRSVGLYSTAVKIYNMIKQVLVAIITVIIPRLTLLTSDTQKFKKFFTRAFNMLFFMSLPTMFGIICMSKNIIYIISSKQYLEATLSLQILGVAMVFALLACILGLGVLLPYNQEKKFLNATIVSALVNIIFNFILIPNFKQDAAAFTTALSQAVAFGICWKNSKKYVDMQNSLKSSIQVLFGCFGILIVCLIIKSMHLDVVLETFLSVLFSIIVYVLIEIFLKNRTIYELLNSIFREVRRKLNRFLRYC